MSNKITMPWTEALWGDIHVGSRIQSRGYEGTFCDDRSGCDSYLLATDDGQIIHCDDSDPVLVRRPRRPALTLGQVEPGTLVMLEGFRHRVLVDYNAARNGQARAARVDTWETHLWPADTSVELVEDES